MITEIKDKLDATKVLYINFTRDIKGTTEYFIAGDKEGKIVHSGEVDDTHKMTTGQPVVTAFKDRALWKEALEKLGIDPDADELDTVDLNLKDMK